MVRLFRMLLILGGVCGGIAVGLGAVLLQASPQLAVSTPPSAQDVAATRAFVRNLRAAAQDTGGQSGVLVTDEDQLNSAIRLGARFVPGFRGQVTVGTAEVIGQVSVPVPWWTGRKWLNVSGRVPEFDQQFRVSDVTVGPVSIPSAWAVFAARVGGNLVIGNGFGDTVMTAATGLRITQDRLSFDIALSEMGKNGVMRGAFGAMRGHAMPAQEEIAQYHGLVRAAMAEGALPQTGSFLPYIRFALAAALERAGEGDLSNAYTAAIFGLTKACGGDGVDELVGRLVFDAAYFETQWQTSCADVTFNGRVDSKQHFITSAALQAASNSGFSISMGEFKELYDTISSGFDFTDMAANLSGVRMSNAFMAAPAAEWPALLALIETENDLIIAFDGIPQLMPEAEFAARYGTIESPQYREMIAGIEARIDRLPLYAP